MVIALSCVGGVVLLCIFGLAIFLYFRRLLQQKSVGSKGDIECENVDTSLEGITRVGVSGDVTLRINQQVYSIFKVLQGCKIISVYKYK